MIEGEERVNWQSFPYRYKHTTVLSFGGGIQTTALAILAVQGKIKPRPRVAVFADTGGELPETYEHLRKFGSWLKREGLSLYTVQDPEMSLEEWVLTRHTVIPAFFDPGGASQRQCTAHWKIRPIYRFIRYSLKVKTFNIQIGISVDEFYRMKPARPKYAENTWPLVDMNLTRQDCLEIIRKEGIKRVGKSACFFCPYQGTHRWLNTHKRHPNLWKRAIRMEKAINSRDKKKGRYDKKGYLSPLLIPLKDLPFDASAKAKALEGGECEGYCFV